MIFILKKIKPEQYDIFRQWLKGIIKPRLPKDMQQEIEDILEKTNQWEVESMVYNLERVIDDVRKKSVEEGIEKGVLQERMEILKKLIKAGSDIEFIKNITGLTEEEIKEAKSKMH
ncbi:hypothetical protein [Clostridium sp. ZS2-4]|uniref:hypothetical protein n=1 Tax=Clostridium sp. ZS2-4 TaxID=2987703 RepID=UPI002DD64703|nr:hypothetical protein [Clostridium sp. ZS2-4]